MAPAHSHRGSPSQAPGWAKGQWSLLPLLGRARPPVSRLQALSCPPKRKMGWTGLSHWTLASDFVQGKQAPGTAPQTQAHGPAGSTSLARPPALGPRGIGGATR